jgi:hypothetical protein
MRRRQLPQDVRGLKTGKPVFRRLETRRFGIDGYAGSM